MPYATILFERVFDVKNIKVSDDKLFPISDNLLNNSSYFLRRQNSDGVVILEYLNNDSFDSIDYYTNVIPDIDENLNFNPYQIWNLHDNKSMKKLIMYSSYYDLWNTDIFKISINNITELDIPLDKFPPDTSDLIYFKYLEIESKIFWSIYNYGNDFNSLYNKLSDLEVFTCLDNVNSHDLWVHMHQDLIVHPKVVYKYSTYKYILCTLSAKKILAIYLYLNIKMSTDFLKILYNYNHDDITPIPPDLKLYCKPNHIQKKPKFSLLNCIVGFNIYTSLLYLMFTATEKYSTSLFLHPILNNPTIDEFISVHTIHLLNSDKNIIMNRIINNNYIITQLNKNVYKISFIKIIILLIFDDDVPNENFEILYNYSKNILSFSPVLGIALITGNYLGNMDLSLYIGYFRLLNKLDDSYVNYESKLPVATAKICSNAINNISDDTLFLLNYYIYVEQYLFIYIEDYDGYVLMNMQDIKKKKLPIDKKVDISKILYYYTVFDDEDNIIDVEVRKVGNYVVKNTLDGVDLLMDYFTNEILYIGFYPLIFILNDTLLPIDTLTVNDIPNLIINQNYIELLNPLININDFDIEKSYIESFDHFSNVNDENNVNDI